MCERGWWGGGSGQGWKEDQRQERSVHIGYMCKIVYKQISLRKNNEE